MKGCPRPTFVCRVFWFFTFAPWGRPHLRTRSAKAKPSTIPDLRGKQELRVVRRRRKRPETLPRLQQPATRRFWSTEGSREAAPNGWDDRLLTFMYPGFNCGSPGIQVFYPNRVFRGPFGRRPCWFWGRVSGLLGDTGWAYVCEGASTEFGWAKHAASTGSNPNLASGKLVKLLKPICSSRAFCHFGPPVVALRPQNVRTNELRLGTGYSLRQIGFILNVS